MYALLVLSHSVHVLPTVSAPKGSDDWRVVSSELSRAPEERGAQLTPLESALLCGEDHARGGVQWVKRGGIFIGNIDIYTGSTYKYNCWLVTVLEITIYYI